MFEQDLYTFLTANITSATHFWGKIIRDFSWEEGDISVNYFIVNNIGGVVTPTYLYNIQFSVRGKYIDAVQSVVNELVSLFHLYNGDIGNYNVWITNVIAGGSLYEEKDLVQIPVTISVKLAEL